jgi:DNA-binding SARP family transcriptional activator
MGWLWPESNFKKARWSLNSAIHGLRKLLGGCSSSLSANYVSLEDGYYRLSPTVQVWTDVDEFDERYEKGRRLERDRCHEDSYRLLMKCYARLGLRGRALDLFRICEKILGQEYGMSPSSETQYLYIGILRDQSA